MLTEYGRVAEWEPGHFLLLVREPIGVAGISVPWNPPVALLIRSLAPALVAGCTTVVKMPGKTAQVNALISKVISEVTSLDVKHHASALEDAGLRVRSLDADPLWRVVWLSPRVGSCKAS